MFLKNIEESITGYSPDNEIVATTVLENLSAYISILRRHIHMEDHRFFKLADTVLSKAEHKSLLEQFETQNQNTDGQTILKKNKRLVAEMRRLIE